MYYLGVDGGGTKTLACIVDDKGKLVFKNISGPTNILENGEVIFRKNIRELLTPVLSEIKPEETISCFGLPAVGEFRDDIKMLRKIIKEEVQIEPNFIVNDVVVGWAGGNLARDGIHLVAGTGTIAYGRKGNREVRVSGWGSIIGDEGSAYYIGVETLREVSKELDGRSKKSLLSIMLFEELGLKDTLDFINFIYDPNKDKRSEIASVAKITYEIALKGEKKAIKILKESAKELVLTVVTVKKKLRLMYPVVTYSGSVIEKNEIMRTEFIKALHEEGYKVRPPQLSPVLGAIVYAYVNYHGYYPDNSFIENLKKIERSEENG